MGKPALRDVLGNMVARVGIPSLENLAVRKIALRRKLRMQPENEIGDRFRGGAIIATGEALEHMAGRMQLILILRLLRLVSIFGLAPSDGGLSH